MQVGRKIEGAALALQQNGKNLNIWCHPVPGLASGKGL